MNASKFSKLLYIVLVITLIASCGGPPQPGPHPWARSDMPTNGLDRVVTYRLQGPASSETLVNFAENRGVNAQSPQIAEKTVFSQMSGTKTQDVQVTDADGAVQWSLGMVKTKRFAGLSKYLTLEPATYVARDSKGNVICGAKIRLDFKKNFIQILSDIQAAKQKDFQSLWYYDIPCHSDGQGGYALQTEQARLVGLVINEVWQFRMFGGSGFFNYGHSITVVGGLPTSMKGGWWEHWDLPDTVDPLTRNDAVGAATVANAAVLDLETSQDPWLEFTSGMQFDQSGAYLIYSAADADQWATIDRFFLDRQGEYVVWYRPNKQTAWDFMRIVPLYNIEWNDVWQNARALYGWTLDGHLSENGTAGANDPVVKELERIGWMNAPNASLDQVRWYDSSGNLLYSMTVRAHIGARDTLLIFSRGELDYNKRNAIQLTDSQPYPIVHDANGNPLPPEQQPYTREQWAEWQRENSFWDYLKDNPNAVSGDLEVQYRFTDNSTWKEVMCTRYDSDNNPVSYVCGYEPVDWDLSTSYYMDGDPTNAWLAIQTLGEVGVRTLGYSYASGLYQGTGVNFALAQEVHRLEYLNGYSGVESLWTFDARALQLPATLQRSWATLHQR